MTRYLVTFEAEMQVEWDDPGASPNEDDLLQQVQDEIGHTGAVTTECIDAVRLEPRRV